MITIIDLDHADSEAFSDFRTYYTAFWSSEQRGMISNDDQWENRDRLQKHIERSDRILSVAGFDTSEISALLFTGSHQANGHAYLQNGKSAAWFALECFGSERSARIFVMHELIHALHYRASPEFWFRTTEEKSLMWRQLLSEGIATYATARLLEISDDEALWADAVDTKQLQGWKNNYHARERELWQYAHCNFFHSLPDSRFFTMSDLDDLNEFRQGYYVGLQIIRLLAMKENLTLRELLSASSNELCSKAIEILAERG